ncbi:hypothetical protein KOR34_34350 [Posidoniimonas corsicana]|uniref:Zinc-ribbon domain-containing protein n=1 Tax=Posidoniimonas corsicana TaxID=1938618 RepID=A0A5C5V6P1_9BACT|nr:zinc ribbon domain-containing protein [Posidoniimonas corsicana]TWT33603.1 hypothetical protein KOR34_34350 [Posidoniimonas corsicana]
MSKPKLVFLALAAVAALGLLTVGSCVALIYSGFTNADAAVSPRIDALFAAIEADTLASTYDSATTQELRDASTREQYVAVGKMIKNRLGRLESKSLRSVNYRYDNGAAYYDVTYSATFENGAGDVVAKMKKSDGEWKFVTFRVNSPLLQQGQAMTACPNCSNPFPANASFCPSCGFALSQAENSPLGE